MKKSSRLQQVLKTVQDFLDESAVLSGDGLSKFQRFAHFWLMVWRSFSRNRCPVRASAMAYVTLLALVPMLAVVVSVTSSFLKNEGEEQIDQFINQLVSSMMPPAVTTNLTTLSTNSLPEAAGAPAAANQTAGAAGQTDRTNRPALLALAQDEKVVAARKEVAHFVHDYIQNARSGALGLTGSVLLIFAAISMLSRIEATFNDIWGVARGRSWFMRIVLYWGVISLVPVLLAVALGLASGPHLEGTRRLLTLMPFISSLIFQILPVVLLCLTFAAFYMLIPNTKVDWRAALVGGFTGGLLFHLNNVVSVLYVSRVVSNSKIYGSLGLVPVFMIGLYLAWWILLFGAQVAYAFQNRTSYLEEKQIELINQRGREFVALRLMTCVGQRFLRGEPPPSVAEMSDELCVPTRLVQQILQVLCSARLVVETTGAEAGYLPARPLETVTCHDILLALRASQGQELATRDEPARLEVYGEFQRIQEAERQVASSVSLLALAHRAGHNQLAGGAAQQATGENREQRVL